MSHGREPKRGIPLVVVASALSFAGGVTDITSFTRLGMVFSSVMPDNLVVFGLAAERASGVLASHTSVAIESYVLGVGLGSLVCGRADARHVLWPARVTATLVVEIVVFAAFTVIWEVVKGHPGGISEFPLLATAALAMGLQSEAMRNVATTLSTTYLTGTLTSTVASLVTRNNRVRTGLNLAILGSAAVRAAAGGGLIHLAPITLPVLPMLAVVGVVAIVGVVGVHD